MSQQVVMFNPFTGQPRDPRDIQSDPYGQLIWDGETPLKAAAPAPDALENCRLFAARHRKEEWAQTILRFCKEGGATGSPLREAAPAPEPAPERFTISRDAIVRLCPTCRDALLPTAAPAPERVLSSGKWSLADVGVTPMVPAAPAPDADAIMALADTWQEEEEHYDRYAGRHKPDAARAALRAAVEQIVADRDLRLKQLDTHIHALMRAERERDEALALLKEARTEMEWWTPDESNATISEQDHLNRWYTLRDRIDALLAKEGK